MQNDEENKNYVVGRDLEQDVTGICSMDPMGSILQEEILGTLLPHSRWERLSRLC